MLNKLGLLNKNQRGFTLIEVLVVVAITGFIGAGTSMAIFQVLNQNTQSNAHMAAVKDVENAVHWISRDAQMAQTVVTSVGSGFPVDMTWVEWDNTTHEVTYSLDGNRLIRNHSINGGPPSETLLSQNIDPDPSMTNCATTSSVFTFQITSTVGSGTHTAVETRLCEITRRTA